MRVGDVRAEIMKREHINVLFVYPLTPLTEYAAAADIMHITKSAETVLRRAGVPVQSIGGRACECAEL